jgi:transcriptional regulator with XRE-family HTH domain
MVRKAHPGGSVADKKRRPSEVFAKRLRETRKARGMSQTELAQRMTDWGRPMSREALLRIENGSRGVSLDEALALAATLFAVPPHLLTPLGDEYVWLTDKMGVDGEGMRAWLRYGDAFIADSGDLPDELVADRLQEAIAVHAQALVDATRGNDEAGKREALRAIGQAVLEGERRRTDA